MAIHEEAVHVTNADLPDEHVGGLFVLYGLRAVQEKGAKQPPCDPTCLETWQSSLFYVFVRYYGG